MSINRTVALGTRVFRNYDGKIGTVVSVREYRPDDVENVGAVGVFIDDLDSVWSGTFEAWDLADGNLDEPDEQDPHTDWGITADQFRAAFATKEN